MIQWMNQQLYFIPWCVSNFYHKECIWADKPLKVQPSLWCKVPTINYFNNIVHHLLAWIGMMWHSVAWCGMVWSTGDGSSRRPGGPHYRPQCIASGILIVSTLGTLHKNTNTTNIQTVHTIDIWKHSFTQKKCSLLAKNKKW